MMSFPALIGSDEGNPASVTTINCKAARAIAQAVIRSVELIIQPDAKDIVGEFGVPGS
jgi:hypothetical protein